MFLANFVKARSENVVANRKGLSFYIWFQKMHHMYFQEVTNFQEKIFLLFQIYGSKPQGGTPPSPDKVVQTILFILKFIGALLAFSL